MNIIINALLALAAGTATPEELDVLVASGFATKAGKLSKAGAVAAEMAAATAPKAKKAGATVRESDESVKAWLKEQTPGTGVAKLLSSFRNGEGRSCNQERFRRLVGEARAELAAADAAPKVRRSRKAKAA